MTFIYNRMASNVTVLFTQYYRPQDMMRQAEIDACLLANCSNPALTTIVVFQESPKHNLVVFQSARPRGTQLIVSPLGRRVKFSDVFREANRVHDRLAPISKSLVMITCNADIVVPSRTVDLMHKHLVPSSAWALSRWDSTKDNRLVHYANRMSQDTWAWKGKLDPPDADFEFGRGGCDNAIAERIRRAGRSMSNPSASVITIHMHRNPAARSWTFEDVSKPYLFLDPCSLEE